MQEPLLYLTLKTCDLEPENGLFEQYEFIGKHRKT